jgi:hypothetical protein
VEQAKPDFQFATRWIFSRDMPTGRIEAHGNVSISRHPQNNVQDGLVWLMIGKPQPKWQAFNR